MRFHEAAKIGLLFNRKAQGIPTFEEFFATLLNTNERTFGVTESFDMAMVPP